MTNLKYAFILIVILIFASNCITDKDTQNTDIISSTSEENTDNELTPENELNSDSRDINLLNVLSTSQLISSIYSYLPADIKLITNNFPGQTMIFTIGF